MALYIGVRFYHVDNQLYLWWKDMRPSQTMAVAHAGSNLPSLYRMEIEGRKVFDIDRNLSGLAFNNETKQLIAVINRPATLLTMTPEGRVLHRHRLRNAFDVEGVAYLGNGHIAIAEEKSNRIVLARLPAKNESELDLRNAASFTFDLYKQEGKKNVGFEGLGYDQARDMLYIAKEHSPRSLYRIKGLGEYIKNGRMAMQVENLSHWLKHKSIGTDLSSAEVDPKNGHLFLLSDESQRIVELDRKGSVLNQIELRGIAGSNSGVPQAEGLAMGDGGKLYMISEPNLFYRLGLVN